MLGFTLLQRRLLSLLNQFSVLHQWSHLVFGSWGVWSHQVDDYDCLELDAVHHQQLEANLNAKRSHPQWSRHYVGVPMFWPDWQDQKMRQHQNHFGALGSSPPGPGEGSLQIE